MLCKEKVIACRVKRIRSQVTANEEAEQKDLLKLCRIREVRANSRKRDGPILSFSLNQLFMVPYVLL